jgi:hypothetical protein
MSSSKVDRVIFYSKEDMAKGENLSLAEPILRNYKSTNIYDVNEIIELYQIKLYIDNDIFLPSWSEEELKQFKDSIKDIWSITITKFWLNVNYNNILKIFDYLEKNYQSAFWELTEIFETFKNIPKIDFKKLLRNPHLWIKHILYQKNLVKYFSQEIREYLLKTDDAAELLLCQFEKFQFIKDPKLYFPACLNPDDKELIIINYLDFQDANINYVNLIIKSRNNNLKLSPKTRLKAKKFAEEYDNIIIETANFINFGCEVLLSNEQKEPCKRITEGRIQKYTYSTKWFNKQNDIISQIYNFIFPFNFIDSFGRITLVSKSNEIGTIEKIKIRSINEYQTGMTFHIKNNLSILQLSIYSFYLSQHGNSVENILSAFIKDHIIENYGLKNFRINFPSDNTSYLEKIRLIVPEIESILKQYKTFVVNGIIDHELIQLSSQSINYENIPSLTYKKYIYGNGNEYQKLNYYFFSYQSALFYVEPFKEKYTNLYDLLTNEQIKLNDFKPYQKRTIEDLIQNEYLIIDSDNFVRIKEETLLLIIKELSLNEVVSYWHYSKSIRLDIDKMVEKGFLKYGETLFSESERKYFNYYLNKKEFTNGFDLRNKYSHGTNTFEEKVQKNDYFILLKILILILLKIEDDLLIFERNKVINI